MDRLRDIADALGLKLLETAEYAVPAQGFGGSNILRFESILGAEAMNSEPEGGRFGPGPRYSQ